jgi:hypothetical protein
MTSIYLFGDSWAEEHGEYEQIYSFAGAKEIPVSLSTLISQHCNLKCFCHAQGGASQFDILIQLLNSNIQANDVAIFVLTSPSRRTYFDDQGTTKTVMRDHSPEGISDYHDSWSSAVLCFSMYQYCVSQDIVPLFINTFNIQYNELCPLWKCIPTQNWILPSDSCVVRELFDPDWFKQYEVYKNNDFSDWLASKSNNVDAYIRPCLWHPNITGRRAMADTIAMAVKNILP